MNSIEIIRGNQLDAAMREADQKGLALGEWPVEVNPVTGEEFDRAKDAKTQDA